MLDIFNYFKARYISNEKAQGMVEYALLLLFVVAVAGIALDSKTGGSLGDGIKAAFQSVATALGAKTSGN